jgi:poly(3-hydroxybutyrate) depolymerase
MWFHGCGGPDRFYNASVHYAGFNEWAETNDLVILYPAMRNWGKTEETKLGCWDSYGQTGPEYALQNGGQMAAVRRMLRDVAGQ